MFVKIEQDIDGQVAVEALSYRYRVSVYRDRFGRIVRDEVLYTNIYSKAEEFFNVWGKNMSHQPTLTHVVFEEHRYTDVPYTIISSKRAEPKIG